MQDLTSQTDNPVTMAEWLIQLSNMGVLLKEWENGGITEDIKERIGSPVIKAIENCSSGIEICWERIPEATGYVLYRKRKGISEKIAEVGMNTDRFVDCMVQNECWGRVYDYCIHACCKDYQSPAGPERKIARLSEVLIIRLNGRGRLGVFIQWFCDEEKNKADGYEVEYAANENDLNLKRGTFHKIRVNGRRRTFCYIKEDRVNSKWFFRVRAYSVCEDVRTKKVTESFSAYSPIVSRSGKQNRDRIRNMIATDTKKALTKIRNKVLR